MLAPALRLLVRIEVVVDVQRVDVVAPHDVEHDARRAIAHSRIAGIHPQIRPVLAHELRIGAADVVRRRRPRHRVAGAIRIDPRVQLEPALVRLGDREGERIVVRLRRAPHLPGEHLGPRLDVGAIQRVGGGPHLQDDGVHAELHALVEDREQLALLLVRGRGRRATASPCCRPWRPTRREARAGSAGRCRAPTRADVVCARADTAAPRGRSGRRRGG